MGKPKISSTLRKIRSLPGLRDRYDFCISLPNLVTPRWKDLLHLIDFDDHLLRYLYRAVACVDGCAFFEDADTKHYYASSLQGKDPSSLGVSLYLASLLNGISDVVGANFWIDRIERSYLLSYASESETFFEGTEPIADPEVVQVCEVSGSDTLCGIENLSLSSDDCELVSKSDEDAPWITVPSSRAKKFKRKQKTMSNANSLVNGGRGSFLPSREDRSKFLAQTLLHKLDEPPDTKKRRFKRQLLYDSVCETPRQTT